MKIDVLMYQKNVMSLVRQGILALQTISKEQGENTNVLTFANAMMYVMLPVVIHEGSCVADAPVSIMVHTPQKGCINRNLFLEYATRWVH